MPSDQNESASCGRGSGAFAALPGAAGSNSRKYMRLEITSPLLPLARVRETKPAAPLGGMWRCTQRIRSAVAVSPMRIACMPTGPRMSIGSFW